MLSKNKDKKIHTISSYYDGNKLGGKAPFDPILGLIKAFWLRHQKVSEFKTFMDKGG